ncbi:hypothetical protein RND71_036424 [Anisodus tanguticus]|uniref:Small auxin up regulated protein n=1 Tax=Anisodus tanguticus TaxID=243964 RepID=A0AAE1V086_9SOLA|nr:hypothetical protein RND71_036424 [Anisodus tanguticus]
MTKGGKLTKIKSVLKKMQSFKLGRVNSINNTIMLTTTNNSSFDDDSFNSYDDNNNNNNLHPVYVGKSRRRYLVTSNVVDHPLFRELVERTGDSDDYVIVGCEVVLFEHLLWMLQNADPQPDQCPNPGKEIVITVENKHIVMDDKNPLRSAEQADND